MRITRTDGIEIGEFASVAEAVESRADLRKADLRKADLSWAYLHKADLRKADLRKADLSWVNLSEADLRKADLRKADLSWADLRQADLREANLSWADLRGADLGGVYWNNAVLANTVGAPWYFGLGQHVAIVHEGQISIGCMTKPVAWWLDHYEAVGKTHHYSEAEIAEYGAWIQFVADRLELRDGDAKAAWL